jgi:hypothetical protein
MRIISVFARPAGTAEAAPRNRVSPPRNPRNLTEQTNATYPTHATNLPDLTHPTYR